MAANNYTFNRTLPSDVSREQFFAAIKHLYPDEATHRHKIQTWTYIFQQKSAYFNSTGMIAIHQKFDEYVEIARKLLEKKAP